MKNKQWIMCGIFGLAVCLVGFSVTNPNISPSNNPQQAVWTCTADSNNTPLTGTAISLPAMMSDGLCSVDLADYYKFTAFNGQYIDVSLNGQAGTDFDLVILDGFNTIVACSTNLGTSVEHIIYSVLSSEVITVGVIRISGDGGYSVNIQTTVAPTTTTTSGVCTITLPSTTTSTTSITTTTSTDTTTTETTTTSTVTTVTTTTTTSTDTSTTESTTTTTSITITTSTTETGSETETETETDSSSSNPSNTSSTSSSASSTSSSSSSSTDTNTISNPFGVDGFPWTVFTGLMVVTLGTLVRKKFVEFYR